LLSLPRTVGVHPSDGEPIVASLGRFGPYIKHGSEYRSLESTNDLLSIGINRAVDLLAQPKSARRRGPATPERALGAHPDDAKPVTAGTGRYGPYVKHGKVYANLPKDRSPDEVTLDEAVTLIAERIARMGDRPAGRGRRAPKSDAVKTDAPAKAASGAKTARKPKGKRSKATEPAQVG
jgi:DNA topoisomerase-1